MIGHLPTMQFQGLAVLLVLVVGRIVAGPVVVDIVGRMLLEADATRTVRIGRVRRLAGAVDGGGGELGHRLLGHAVRQQQRSVGRLLVDGGGGAVGRVRGGTVRFGLSDVNVVGLRFGYVVQCGGVDDGLAGRRFGRRLW